MEKPSVAATKRPPIVLDEKTFPLTSEWLSAAPIPPLEGDQGVAERLVLLVHYGVDFTIWDGSRRFGYWDALSERIRAATYGSRELAGWWESISMLIGSSPRNRQEREEVLKLLSYGDDKKVLRILREHATVLGLRARIVSENRREKRSREDSEDHAES